MDDRGEAPWGDPKFEQAVRETAYFMWEHDGRPSGREQDYWYRALEATLRERNADASLRHAPPAEDERQIDDNQDDLGRDINDPSKASGDQASA